MGQGESPVPPQAGAQVAAQAFRAVSGHQRTKDLSMRLYNLLLHLYPASFRNEYADEMRPLFERERKAARGFGIAGLWLRIIGDMLVNAAGAHLEIGRRRRAPTRRWASSTGTG
jgi:hypothetical protein